MFNVVVAVVVKTVVHVYKKVDAIIAVTKLILLENLLSVLNTFHQNIKFTWTKECNSKIDLLDALLIRKNDTLETNV